jgi:hypothetical protein
MDEVFAEFGCGGKARGELAGVEVRIESFAELGESEPFVGAVDAASLYDRRDGCLEPRVELKWAGSALAVALEASVRGEEACIANWVT